MVNTYYKFSYSDFKYYMNFYIEYNYVKLNHKQ